MKFIREMIARKSQAEEAAEEEEFGFEEETILDVQKRLAEPASEAVDDDIHWDGDEDGDGDAAEAGAAQVDGAKDAPVPASAQSDDDWDADFTDGFEEGLEETLSDDDMFDEEDAASAPEAKTGVPDPSFFDDIPDTAEDEPVPELSAEDIERAMKLRKKMWRDVPGDEELASEKPKAAPAPTPAPAPAQAAAPVAKKTVTDLETYRPVSRPVTRPVSRRTSQMFKEVGDSRQPAEEIVANDQGVADTEATPQPAPDAVMEDAAGFAEAAAEPIAEPVAEVAATAAAEDTAPTDAAPAANGEDVDIQSLMAAAAAAKAAEPAPIDIESPSMIEMPAPAQGRGGRRAGRVKTRLLGFQPDDAEGDIFDAATNKPATHAKFPVGWLVVASGPGRGSSFSLHQGVSLIGRGEDQAVRLDFGDTAISRDNHASVAFDDEQNKFYLGYGGKSNMVRLNDRPVLSTEEMADGDLIRIGETTLRFAALCGEDFNWADDQGDTSDHAAIA